MIIVGCLKVERCISQYTYLKCYCSSCGVERRSVNWKDELVIDDRVNFLSACSACKAVTKQEDLDKIGFLFNEYLK